MKKTTAILLLVCGLALSAIDVSPPASGAYAWMRADVQAKLPATLVISAGPVVSGRAVVLDVLPGPGCLRAIATLDDSYRVLVDGLRVSSIDAGALCQSARVHRIEVRA